MASAAPKIGAVRYTQRLSVWPETIAGARERAGFMDAPQIGPANIASSRITDPMAMPANNPCSLDPVATPIMTSIRKKVRINSRIKDCQADPAGRVVPRSSSIGKRSRSIKLARNAPAISLTR